VDDLTFEQYEMSRAGIVTGTPDDVRVSIQDPTDAPKTVEPASGQFYGIYVGLDAATVTPVNVTVEAYNGDPTGAKFLKVYEVAVAFTTTGELFGDLLTSEKVIFTRGLYLRTRVSAGTATVNLYPVLGTANLSPFTG